jgi:hypothetical protein
MPQKLMHLLKRSLLNISCICRKKERRETWAASRTRHTMGRKSLYAFALHHPLPPIPCWNEPPPPAVKATKAAGIPEEEEEVGAVSIFATILCQRCGSAFSAFGSALLMQAWIQNE